MKKLTVRDILLILAFMGGIGSFIYGVGYSQSEGKTADLKVDKLEKDFNVYMDTLSEEISEKADKAGVKKLNVEVDSLRSNVAKIQTTQDIEFRNLKESDARQLAKLDAILAKIEKINDE